MRVYLFSILILISSPGFSQYSSRQNFDFDVNQHIPFFIIDTISNPINIWQIGKPQKTTFISARSLSNAIVTDTVNTYRPNDTSTFYIKCHKNHYVPFDPNETFEAHFWYKMDIAGKAFGKLEVSGDSGFSWVNVLEEDTTYKFYWGTGKPRLDTTTSGWQRFSLQMSIWADAKPGDSTMPSYITSDTFLFKFTFISDSTQSTKDGWMIDDFEYEDYYLNIETITNNNLISIYPNPADDYIYIKANYTYDAKPKVFIYNLQGQEVYATEELPKNGYLHVNLPAGMYTLVYSTDTERAVKQLVIQN